MYVERKKAEFWIATTRFNDTTLRRNRRWMENIGSTEWECVYGPSRKLNNQKIQFILSSILLK